MEFFQTFWTWLNAELGSYIGENTARVASILEPALITLGTVYVMIWGYLHLTGRIEEPFVAGLKRIVTLAVVFGVGLHLWLYNSLLVDTFYDAPTEFAAAVVGASDPVQTIDTIWKAGGAVADQLYRDGTGFNASHFGYMLAGIVVWLLVGLLCIYTMFLLALSSVALSVLLALGPLFVTFLLFDTTRRFFEAWLAQLANYALITILTVMIAVLMLHLVQTYAEQTEALGTAIHTVDAINMLLATVLVFLFLRQVMPIAAALAGGVALNSLGTLGAAARMIRAPVRAAMAGVALAQHVGSLRSNESGGARQPGASVNPAAQSGGAS